MMVRNTSPALPAGGGRPHGRAKYAAEKCRCPVCTAANTAYTRRRDRRIAAGKPHTDLLVDAAPVRTHVRGLLDAGASHAWVADTADVPLMAVKNLLGYAHRPPQRRMRPAAAAALLAVRLDTGPARGAVDLVAVARACTGEPVKLTRAEKRVAAGRLLAAGRTATDIARRLRLSGATVNLLVAEAESGEAAA